MIQAHYGSVETSNLAEDAIEEIRFIKHTTIPCKSFDAANKPVESCSSLQHKFVEYARRLNVQRENWEVSQKKLSTLREKMVRELILAGEVL